METEICPIIEGCSFFNDSLLSNDFVGETYKKKFCLKSPQFRQCKRYLVYTKTGKQAPEYIMPNSQLTIDEIHRKIDD